MLESPDAASAETVNSPSMGGSRKKVVRKKKVGRKKRTAKKTTEELRVAVTDALVVEKEASAAVAAESASPVAAKVEAAAKNPSFTLRFGKGVNVAEALGEELDMSVDGSSMDSSSLSSGEEDESGPCLACRMEKKGCLGFKADKSSALCGTCGHASDAHASRLKF